MKTTHTTGPWSIHQDAIIGNVDGGYGEDGSKTRYDVVCSMYDGHFEQLDNWQSNARLIAAAPELLEALERFIKWFDTYRADEYQSAMVIQCREAIKKAKGE